MKKRSYADVVAIDHNNQLSVPVPTSKPFLDTPEHSKLQQQQHLNNTPKAGLSPAAAPKKGVSPNGKSKKGAKQKKGVSPLPENI